MRSLVHGLFLLLFLLPLSTRAELWKEMAASAKLGVKTSTPMRATHYWGRSAPTNFWNSLRVDDIEADFTRLRADGFDTIVLAVPWGDFQPQVNPCCRENAFAWEMLDLLSARAQAKGLNLIVRVGYPWSMEPDQQWQSLQRIENIFTDDEALATFARFVGKVGAIVGHRSNFKFAFFSWEDFCLQRIFKQGTGRLRGTALEREYRRFLEKHYSLAQLRAIFLDPGLRRFSAVPYPVSEAAYPGDERVRLFNKFWDELLVERIYKAVKQELGAMSMEVRVDAEPLPLKAGGYAWIDHKGTYALPQAPFLTAYYAIPWGMANNKDFATPQAALDKFQHLLADLGKHFPREKIFFDQLLFLDNTPGFEANTKLDPGEINSFLERLAEPLSHTSGYSLWHWRDYLASYFYNGGFQLGMKGWQTEGAVALIDRGESHNMLIGAGGAISQTITLERHLMLAPQQTKFCADVRSVSTDFSGSVVVAGLRQFLPVQHPGRHCIAVEFAPGAKIKILAERGRIELESVYLYSHEQVQGVYGAEGHEGPYAKGVRELNRRLTHLPVRSWPRQ